MLSATAKALESPASLAQAIEKVMQGVEDPSILADIAEGVTSRSPPVEAQSKPIYESSVPSIQSDTARVLPLTPQAKSKLVTESVAGGSQPLKGEEPMKHDGTGEEDKMWGMVGGADATEDPTPGHSCGESSEVEMSEMEAFEKYILEIIDTKVELAKETLRGELENKVAGLTTLITKLQRRVEIAELPGHSRHQSVQLHGDNHKGFDKLAGKEHSTVAVKPSSSYSDHVRKLISGHRAAPADFSKMLLLNKLLADTGSKRKLTAKDAKSVLWTEAGLTSLCQSGLVSVQSLTENTK